MCGWSPIAEEASVASKLVGLNRRVMEIRHPPPLLPLQPPSSTQRIDTSPDTAAIINDSPVKRLQKNIFPEEQLLPFLQNQILFVKCICQKKNTIGCSFTLSNSLAVVDLLDGWAVGNVWYFLENLNTYIDVQMYIDAKNQHIIF